MAGHQHISWTRLVWAVLASVSLVAACGDDKDGYDRPIGRGSDACQAWQKSLCDYLALDCGLMSEQECVESYYGTSCLSDEQAQSCADTLDAASCSAPPANCNPADVADPEPAVNACETFVDTTCDRAVECGSGTYEECVAVAEPSVDCSRAIAYGPTYETCIDSLQELACTASTIPESCEKVIKLLE